MKRARIVPLAAAAVIALGAAFPAKVVLAAMFDFMNPGRWFGDDDRYGRYGRYGYGGPYGWGGGPYGWGGGPYGWGGGPYGWGGGPYGWGGPYGGWGGYPGYGGGNTIVVTPQGSGDKNAPKLPE